MKGVKIMEEYQSNSHKSKVNPKPERRIEKVVSGSTKTKKKGGAHKLADVFITEDFDSVKSYIIAEVVVPAIVNAIEDVIVSGTRMLLRGEKGKSKNSYNSSRVSYKSFYDKDNDRRKPNNTSVGRGFAYDEVEFETRGDAEAVLDAMSDSIDRYGFVSVADFYDLAGVTTTNYTINKFGWNNISTAKVIRDRNCYTIDLPKAKPLD